jgi:hypothetical protein
MKADVKAMVISIGALREKDLLFNQDEKAMLAKELAIGLISLFDPEPVADQSLIKPSGAPITVISLAY